MATKKTQRYFALLGAILFLVTSSSLAIAYIVANVQADHNNSSSGSSTSKAATTSSNTAKLQGTKMQDFTPVSSVPSLQITDLTKGSGATVKPGDTVTVNYTGAVAATGTIFQSSLDSGQPVTFSLDEVIAGWKEGLPGTKVGGTRRLLIPADLAYGASPPPDFGIPANAALVFDITVISVKS